MIILEKLLEQLTESESQFAAGAMHVAAVQLEFMTAVEKVLLQHRHVDEAL